MQTGDLVRCHAWTKFPGMLGQIVSTHHEGVGHYGWNAEIKVLVAGQVHTFLATDVEKIIDKA